VLQERTAGCKLQMQTSSLSLRHNADSLAPSSPLRIGCINKKRLIAFIKSFGAEKYLIYSAGVKVAPQQK